METNKLFSLKRFMSLVTTGFFRRRIFANKLVIIIEVSALALLTFLYFIIGLKSAPDIVALTQIYQILYAVILTIPCVTMNLDKNRNKYWNLLPASTFEKRVFIFLKNIVLYSILFFIAISILNMFLSTHDNPVRIGPKEIFMLQNGCDFITGWPEHILTFLVLSLPAVGIAGFNSSIESLTNRIIAGTGCVFLIPGLFLGSFNTPSFMLITIAACSLCFYFDFFITPIAEFRKSK